MAFKNASTTLVRTFSTTSIKCDRLVKTPVPLFGIEGRYVSALYSAASKQKSLDAVENDIKQIQGLLKTDKKFRDFLVNPLIKKSTKRDAIQESLKKKFNPLTVNFFGALAENGRLKKVESILATYNEVMSSHRGEVLCEIVSAKALDEATLKEVTGAMQGLAKKGEVLKIKTRVNPELIGGLVVSVGDRFVDMSLAAKIKQYSKIVQTPV